MIEIAFYSKDSNNPLSDYCRTFFADFTFLFCLLNQKILPENLELYFFWSYLERRETERQRERENGLSDNCSNGDIASYIVRNVLSIQARESTAHRL